MHSTLKKWFFYWSLGMVLLSILFSIFLPNKKIDLTEVDFTTTQSSELYFKNMRSYFYDKDENEEANFKLYRIDSRVKDSSKNKLNFVLLSNWLQSECYIMAESGILDLSKETLQVLFKNADTSGRLSLAEQDSYANYIFAAQLYTHLDQGSEISLELDKTHHFSESEKKSLKKSLSDYFKLVGKLR